VDVVPDSDQRTGVLVEIGATPRIFANPSDERTENYITGRFG
jgi:phosphate transport system ATP-binding protein